MRDLSPAFRDALVNARDRGIVPRKLVSFTAWTWPDANGATTKETMSFWNEDDDLSISVVSQIDNETYGRTFFGGINLSVDRIVRSSKLVIQTVPVRLSANAPIVEEAIRGLDIRLATVEIWDALLDPVSRELVGMEAAFLGVVDGAPINDEGENGEEVIEINVVNDLVVMLTRTNPAKSSHEEQKKRVDASGDEDEISKYAGSVSAWKVPWGEK